MPLSCVVYDGDTTNKATHGGLFNFRDLELLLKR